VIKCYSTCCDGNPVHVRHEARPIKGGLHPFKNYFSKEEICDRIILVFCDKTNLTEALPIPGGLQASKYQSAK